MEIITTEPARYRFMREAVEHMIRLRPVEMRAVAEEMRRTAKAQLDPKTGKWRSDQGGLHFTVSFPAIFMQVLRPLMKRFLPEEPPFAEDDSDLIWLMREFPDLVQGPAAGQRPAPRKDRRPRTRIK